MLNMFDNNTNKSYLVEFDNFLSQLVSLFENNASTKTEFDIVTDIKFCFCTIIIFK